MKRFAISEHDHKYPEIKAGKRYEVLGWVQDNASCGGFEIITEDGMKANCIFGYGGCAFLDGELWTIIEEEELTKKGGLSDQVRVCEIGAEAIRAVLYQTTETNSRHAMHAVMAALSRNGYAIEDRYGRQETTTGDENA